MSTNEFSLHEKIVIYIIKFIPVAYYSFVYVGPKKLQAYTIILIGSAFIWVGILYVVNKTSLLYSSANQTPVTANLGITDVRKYKSKIVLTAAGSLSNMITIPLNSALRASTISRSLIKRALKQISASGTDNYYINKIYWEPNEVDRARSMYWQDWRHRMRLIPLIVLGVIALIPIVLYFKRKQEANWAAPTKWSGVAIYLKIMGIIIGLLLLAYFTLLGYLYFRYGHIG